MAPFVTELAAPLLLPDGGVIAKGMLNGTRGSNAIIIAFSWGSRIWVFFVLLPSAVYIIYQLSSA